MPVSTKPVEDDVDVASERQRVLRGDADNDMVKIENLTKVGLGHEEERPGGGVLPAVSGRGSGCGRGAPCGDVVKGEVGQVPRVALGQGRTQWGHG